MANRLTQEVVEVLQVGGNPNVRLTQEVVEVLQVGGNPNVRLTQEVVEVLVRLSIIPSSGGISIGSNTISSTAVEKITSSGGVTQSVSTFLGYKLNPFSSITGAQLGGEFSQLGNFGLGNFGSSITKVIGTGGDSNLAPSFSSNAIVKIKSSGNITEVNLLSAVGKEKVIGLVGFTQVVSSLSSGGGEDIKSSSGFIQPTPAVEIHAIAIEIEELAGGIFQVHHISSLALEKFKGVVSEIQPHALLAGTSQQIIIASHGGGKKIKASGGVRQAKAVLHGQVFTSTIKRVASGNFVVKSFYNGQISVLNPNIFKEVHPSLSGGVTVKNPSGVDITVVSNFTGQAFSTSPPKLGASVDITDFNIISGTAFLKNPSGIDLSVNSFFEGVAAVWNPNSFVQPSSILNGQVFTLTIPNILVGGLKVGPNSFNAIGNFLSQSNIGFTASVGFLNGTSEEHIVASGGIFQKILQRFIDLPAARTLKVSRDDRILIVTKEDRISIVTRETRVVDVPRDIREFSTQD